MNEILTLVWQKATEETLEIAGLTNGKRPPLMEVTFIMTDTVKQRRVVGLGFCRVRNLLAPMLEFEVPLNFDKEMGAFVELNDIPEGSFLRPKK